MNGNNGLLVPRQRRNLFISVYDHLQTSENTLTVSTAYEREVTARCHRTKIISKRKTNIVYILQMTTIFRDIATIDY